ERAIEIQHLLGSDIAMQLDECLQLPASQAELRRAMQLSLAWAERSKRAFERTPGPALFAIVQGGDDLQLRAESARVVTDMGFHGYAIGGRARRAARQAMGALVHGGARAPPPAPAPHPLAGWCARGRGGGTAWDVVGAAGGGWDGVWFAVRPPKGRHGLAFLRLGPINLKNARHADDPRPIDEAGACAAARDYSRAYLHHLVKA